MVSRGIACLTSAVAFLLALAVMAVTATACEGGGGGGPELTSLSTRLSHEGEEGEELAVVEGSKVKDKATLTGRNASTATGRVSYKIYSERACRTLVTNAGEVTVSGESVPASSEVELEGGSTYYWQAHYGGDSRNAESTSPCTEILKVVACTWPYCAPTITPGVAIKILVGSVEKTCTAGPIMTRGTEMFLLTAGHCFGTGEGTITQAVESVYPRELGVKKVVGENVTFNSSRLYDTGEAKITNTAWLLANGGAPPFLAEWEPRPKVTSVVGKAANLEGEETCLSGSATGRRCGKILRVGVTEAGHENLVETSIRASSGDSGGPVFTSGLGLGAAIQGTLVSAEGFRYRDEGGTLTRDSNLITEVSNATSTCREINEMKTKWPVTGVPVEATGVPAETIVERCLEANATVEMSQRATVGGDNILIIFGHTDLSYFEPLSQIEAVPRYAGQRLLTK
jgi:hypothetical protein